MTAIVFVIALLTNLPSGIRAKVDAKIEIPPTQPPIEHILRFNYPFDVFLTPVFYYNCEEAWKAGFKRRGIYSIALKNLPNSSNIEQRWSWIVCNNTEQRASTVILYRESGIENFTRTFEEYVRGFGSAKSDYFIGLENIRNLTKHGHNVLTITIQDSLDNVHSIRYEFFMLKGAPDYQFDTNGNGQGDLPDDFYLHRNVPFTAPGKPDKRADGLSCAEKLQVGWWFLPKDNCAYALLTGRFVSDKRLCHPHAPYPICNGLYWLDWAGFTSLKHVTVELSRT